MSSTEKQLRNGEYSVILSEAKDLSSEMVRFFTEFTLSEVEWVQNDVCGGLFSLSVSSYS